MSDKQKSEKTSDKMIENFKDKADAAVDDARRGETDDNPIKETVRNSPETEDGDDADRDQSDRG